MLRAGSAHQLARCAPAASSPGRCAARARSPRRAAPGVPVRNIARPGGIAPELALIFDRVLPNYERLDLLIVMVGASTVYHWLEDGAPLDRPPAVVPEDALFAHHPGQRFSWNPRAS